MTVIRIALIISSLSTGLFLPSNTATAMVSVPPKRQGAAAGIAIGGPTLGWRSNYFFNT